MTFIWVAAIGTLLLMLILCYAVRWSKPRPPKLIFNKLAFTHWDKEVAIKKAKELDALGYTTRMIEDPTCIPLDPHKRWQVWIAKEMK